VVVGRGLADTRYGRARTHRAVSPAARCRAWVELTIGVRGYAEAGMPGRPSAADSDKGRRLLEEFSRIFKDALGQVR
jgi:hypothetical protein